LGGVQPGGAGGQLGGGLNLVGTGFLPFLL
jgi:hypothetical protein